MKTTSQKIKSFSVQNRLFKQLKYFLHVSVSTVGFCEVQSITHWGICHLWSDFWVMDVNKSALQMATFHDCIQFWECCYLIVLLFLVNFISKFHFHYVSFYTISIIYPKGETKTSSFEIIITQKLHLCSSKVGVYMLSHKSWKFITIGSRWMEKHSIDFRKFWTGTYTVFFGVSMKHLHFTVFL